MQSTLRNIENRDIALVKKVSKYYFQFKLELEIENVDSLFEYGFPIKDIGSLVKAYLFLQLFRYLISDVNKRVDEAKKNKLKYREFTVSFDKRPYGPIDVSKSIPVIPQRMYAYFTFKEGYNAPEYAILNYLIRRMYVTGEKYLESVREISKNVEIFKELLDQIEKGLNKLYSNLYYFKGEFFRPITTYDPPWLQKVYEDYIYLKKLETTNIGIGIKHRSNEEIIEIDILWKLYEIYVVSLLLTYLLKRGYRIRSKDKFFVAEKPGKILHIFMNTNISHLSRLVRVGNRKDVEDFQGRPDILLYDENNKNLIIFECKYSTTLSYITESRFKIMAYGYEYEPLTVVLVYPGIEEAQKSYYNDEEKATLDLNSDILNYGYVDFEFRNGNKLFMVALDPLSDDDDERNISYIEKILNEYNI